MARPREFDEEIAIAQVRDLFWEYGYDATSVADLMEATGLAKGSLYKAFGNKRNLFLLSLDSYLEETTVMLGEILSSAETGCEAIETFLLNATESATCSGVRRGCFAVNSATELSAHDPEVRKRLTRSLEQKETLIMEAIRRGITDNSLHAGLDARVSAGFIITVINGLQIRGKLGVSKEEARNTVALVMDTLR